MHHSRLVLSAYRVNFYRQVVAGQVMVQRGFNIIRRKCGGSSDANNTSMMFTGELPVVKIGNRGDAITFDEMFYLVGSLWGNGFIQQHAATVDHQSPGPFSNNGRTNKPHHSIGPQPAIKLAQDQRDNSQ